MKHTKVRISGRKTKGCTVFSLTTKEISHSCQKNKLQKPCSRTVKRRWNLFIKKAAQNFFKNISALCVKCLSLISFLYVSTLLQWHAHASLKNRKKFLKSSIKIVRRQNRTTSKRGKEPLLIKYYKKSIVNKRFFLLICNNLWIEEVLHTGFSRQFS